ncbi:MAG: hypothetical protein CSA38_02300 [Flavobacteriales bacterium]|nr:MAG: hypothetical protein CSA38_02300 [Flavobacteriales bacterium]
MRLSNKSKTVRYQFLYNFLMFILVLGVGFFLIDFFLLERLGWKDYFLLGIPFILVFLFLKRGRQIFEYDSDGEVLNITNRSVMPFMSKDLRDEFPKYKLMEFYFTNILFSKNLYMIISSKKKGEIRLKYDVSYLTKKEIKDLKTSLNRVIKNNKENQKINEQQK